MMLKPKEAAKRLNVTVLTLQRWDRQGILIANRYATNRRYYTEAQIESFLNNKEVSK
jgi:putative resolvase